MLDEETQEDIAFKMEEELLEYYSYLKKSKTLKKNYHNFLMKTEGIGLGKLSIEELNDFRRIVREIKTRSKAIQSTK